MTVPAGPAGPPPGWYRDPQDASAVRWWDGRAWTDHRSATVPRQEIEQPPLAPGTQVHTVWIWLLGLVPLLVLAAEQPVLLDFGSIFREQLLMQRDLLAHPGTLQAIPAGAGQLPALLGLAWGVSFLLIGLSGLAAYLDRRTLLRRGVVRPFPWGWGFATGVYTVGRAVVVHRRTGRGFAPLWVAAGALVLGMGIQLAEFLSTMAVAVQLPSS